MARHLAVDLCKCVPAGSRLDLTPLASAYVRRYDAVNAMLLNEFLKEHRKVQRQNEIDALKAELKEQRALIQKVSAQLELSKTAPQTVLNKR